MLVTPKPTSLNAVPETKRSVSPFRTPKLTAVQGLLFLKHAYTQVNTESALSGGAGPSERKLTTKQKKKQLGKQTKSFRGLADDQKGGYSDPETMESGLYLRKNLHKK